MYVFLFLVSTSLFCQCICNFIFKCDGSCRGRSCVEAAEWRRKIEEVSSYEVGEMIAALELSVTACGGDSLAPFFRGLRVIEAQAAQLRHLLESYGITVKKAAPAKKPFKHGVCASRVWTVETARGVVLGYVKPAFISLLEGLAIRCGDLLAHGLRALEKGICALKVLREGGYMNLHLFEDGMSKKAKEDVLKAEMLAVIMFMTEIKNR